MKGCREALRISSANIRGSFGVFAVFNFPALTPDNTEQENNTMNNLIPQDHSVRISSRDIAEATNKRHADVLRDIKILAEQEAITERNFALSDYRDASGKKNPEYLLDFEATMTLVTGYDAKRRAAVISRWHDLETGAAQPAFAIPKTYAEALSLAAEQAKQIEMDAHKVDFFNAVAESSDLILLREAAKILAVPNLGQNTLFQILRKAKVLMESNEPYQKYVNQGYFMVRERTYRKGEEIKVAKTTMVTQKGLDFLRRLIIKNIKNGRWLNPPNFWQLPECTKQPMLPNF